MFGGRGNRGCSKEIRRTSERKKARGGIFRPVAHGLQPSIASCKVTAVKFSGGALNFSGIPIYSAVRIYLFRASSLFLPRPFSLDRGATPQLPISPFSLSFSLFYSPFHADVRSADGGGRDEARRRERVHVRRTFVAHARL